jgi:hypothetical protein
MGDVGMLMLIDEFGVDDDWGVAVGFCVGFGAWFAKKATKTTATTISKRITAATTIIVRLLLEFWLIETPYPREFTVCYKSMV